METEEGSWQVLHVEAATMDKEKTEESVCSLTLKVFCSEFLQTASNPDFSRVVLVKPALFQA